MAEIVTITPVILRSPLTNLTIGRSTLTGERPMQREQDLVVAREREAIEEERFADARRAVDAAERELEIQRARWHKAMQARLEIEIRQKLQGGR